jgi:putative dimethyl sulfoxide reductase chaperone
MNHSKEETLALFREAVAQDLTILATLHHAELDNTLLEDLTGNGFPAGMGLRLLSEEGFWALDLMSQSLADLASPLPGALRDELAADYAAIYLTYAYHASPCESVWLDQENLAMQAPMFQVREFYRLFNLVAADWRTRPDDHLVLEIQFLAALFRDGHPQALAEAARFLDTHLLRWLPQFGQRVSARCTTPFYAGAARLTAAYCDELRGLLAELLGEPRPSADEVEANMRPRPIAQSAPMTFVPGLAPSW